MCSIQATIFVFALAFTSSFGHLLNADVPSYPESKHVEFLIKPSSHLLPELSLVEEIQQSGILTDNNNGTNKWLPFTRSSVGMPEVHIRSLHLNMKFNAEILPKKLVFAQGSGVLVANDEAQRIASFLGASKTSTGDGYRIECERRSGYIPPLRFELGDGHDVWTWLEFDNYIAEVANGECELMIKGYSNDPQAPIILGDQMFKVNNRLPFTPEVHIRSLRLNMKFNAEILPKKLIFAQGSGVLVANDEAQRIASFLGASKTSTGDGYRIDCERRSGYMPPLRLELGDGHDAWTWLEFDNYIAEVADGECELMIKGYSKDPQAPIILGDQMFKVNNMNYNTCR